MPSCVNVSKFHLFLFVVNKVSAADVSEELSVCLVSSVMSTDFGPVLLSLLLLVFFLPLLILHLLLNFCFALS